MPNGTVHGRGRLGPDEWLSFAAAPAFALMALLNAGAGEPPGMHPSPLGGMVAMYLLMSAVHSAPWLRLIAPARPNPESRR
ncbi:MAG: hypothetical protein ABI626_03140 [Sphingomicrobium sp.]